MTAAKLPYILILEDLPYRRNQERALVRRIGDSGFEPTILKADPDSELFGIPEFVYENPSPAAIVRWEENGGLYGSLRAYRRLTKWCYLNGIAPITVDFAFFDHYNGLTFDLLREDGTSGIDRDWARMPDNIEFERISGNVGSHIRMIRSLYREERKKPPEHGDYLTVAFLQSALRRCLLDIEDKSLSEWVRILFEIFGEKIIFKKAPSPTLKEITFPKGARRIERKRFPNKERLIRFNAQLAVHADYVITNSSGVTNEFLVTGIPVITTGESYFSGKGVFKEARSLDVFRNPDGWKPRVYKKPRAKYIHWILDHQCLHGEPSEVLRNLLASFKNRQ